MPEDLTALAYRLLTVEENVKSLSNQLQSYVPVRENDLKLQSIQEAVRRIETDVTKAKEQLTDLNAALTAQEIATRKREAEQREEQAKLQIRVLWGIVSTVAGVLVALLIAYLTHALF